MLGRRDDTIDRVDKRTFGIKPHLWLVLGGTRAQLDIAQRVEHREMRDVPVGPGPAGDQPVPGRDREPVVRVNHVVADALAAAEGLNALGELFDGHDQAVVIDRFGRTGGDLDQARAGREFFDVRRINVNAAREDIDGHAQRAQALGDASHVEVHAAGLAATERRERRCVEREHGDAGRAHSYRLLSEASLSGGR